MSSLAKIIISIVLVIVLTVSLVFAVKATKVETHSAEIEYLEQKEQSGKGLIAASAATSVAMTLLPGDVGTPLAEKFADISGYFTIALCAIFLEKYLLTLTGLVAFKFLIPGACVLGLFGVIFDTYRLRHIAIKIGLFAIAIYMLVPFSVKASQIIEATYNISQIEISEYTDSASSKAVTSPAVTGGTAGSSANSGSNTSGGTNASGGSGSTGENSTGFFEKIANAVKSFGQKVEKAVTEIPETVSNNVNSYLEEGEKKLSQLIEGLAIMIVTTCLIPLLVIILFLYLLKILMGLDVDPLWIKDAGAKARGAIKRK